MKNLILTATFLVAGVLSTMAQGEIDFHNEYWQYPDALQGGGTIDRLVYTAAGQPVGDATWYAVLVEDKVGNGTWTRVKQLADPLADGGNCYFYGAGLEGVFASDGIKRNASVSKLAVEIYDGTGTMLYRGGGDTPNRDFFSYTRGNTTPPATTDTMPMGLRAITVPEPSTIALGVLGLGALLLFRRRK